MDKQEGMRIEEPEAVVKIEKGAMSEEKRLEYGTLYKNKGTVKFEAGKWDDAIEDYTVAISIASDYGLAYYNRAIANHSVGKLLDACSDLKISEKYGARTDGKIKEKICQ